MARILYGVSGDGMGHSTRSKVIINQLSKKHDIKIVAGDKAYDYLSKFYKDIHEIFALRIVYGNNKVHKLKTAIYNIKKYPKGRKESLDKIYRIILDFEPDIIITDFEYFTALAAKKLKIPCISIDNNHIINKCKVDIPKSELPYYLDAKFIVDSIVSKADHFFITTFFYPERKYDNVSLVPLILRKEIKKLLPKEKEMIFVYQSSDTYDALIHTLKKLDMKFVVYGLNKENKDENIIFRKFNEKQFYEDIKNCKAVITNGGFTLISEALSLRKPILSIPIRRQFEQICNAVYIHKLGYGEYHKKITHDIIENFIEKIPDYKKNLSKFKKQDDKKLFSEIDKKIDELILKKTKP